MVTNAGKRISQFDVVGIFATAFDKSATMGKDLKGFEATGLWPFNDNIFTEDDFAAAHLTDEEPPLSTDTNNNTTDYGRESELQRSPQPRTSKESDAQELLTSLCSPPKPKQKRVRKRKAEKATVITSSPYK